MKYILKAEVKSSGHSLETNINYKKKCVVEFDVSEDFLLINPVGFDKYNKENLPLKNEVEFKNIYSPCNICGYEYYFPWLSIRVNEKVKMRVKFRIINGEFDKIEPQHDAFKFEPSVFTKDTKEVIVTCIKPIEVESQIKIYADDVLAGGINVYPNKKVKKCKLRLIYTQIGNNCTTYEDISLKLIERYLKSAFKASMIDFSILSSVIFSVRKITKEERNKIKKMLKNRTKKNKSSNNETIKKDKEEYWSLLNLMQLFRFWENIKEQVVQNGTLFVSALSTFYEKENQIDSDTIYLFLTNLANYSERGFVNGGHLPGSRYCCMFLGNDVKMTDKEIPHELMHALGCKHIFPEEDKEKEAPFIFKQGSTNNYMDYHNANEFIKVFQTMKFQWDQVQKSNFVK